MATVVRDIPYHDRRIAERRRIAYPAALRADGVRVSWGGVFGGVPVALGFLLLMTALGVAVGISAAQPGETDTGTLGAGAGIWAGVSLLVALFIGGWVSTRIGAIFDGTTGFFEGALVWVVSVLLMLYMASSGIGMLADGAFGLVGGAAKALGQGETAQRIENNRGNPAQQAADEKNGVAQLIEKAGGALQQKAEEVKPEATRAGGGAQAGEGGTSMRTLVTLGLGALAMYLLDPQHGRGRRTLVRDRLARARRFVSRQKPDGMSYRQYVASTDTPQGAQHLGR